MSSTRTHEDVVLRARKGGREELAEPAEADDADA